jgi:histone deacetylase 1/2
MVEDIGSSKQAPQADANAMAIEDPGNTKHEPEGSTKTLDQPPMYHKP